MGDTEKISVLILSLKKVHCKIIGYTDIKDFDQTAHLRISDVNISIKDPGGGGWLRGGGMVEVGNFKKSSKKKVVVAIV